VRIVEVNQPPIYLLSGMTPEFPIFVRLAPLLPNSHPVEFIVPKTHERLTEYSARLAEHLDPQSYIVGTSFGGIIALEISRILRPKGCILISSIRDPNQLPPWFRIWRKLGPGNCSKLLQLIGHSARLVPKTVCTHSTMRVRKLAGNKGKWYRWATSAVLEWQPTSDHVDFPVLQIHGTADATFPIRYTKPDISVPNATHSLPISHPNEVANAIVAFARAA
jgi:pimeloyl-ACP methyl ester carboxylesterase